MKATYLIITPFFPTKDSFRGPFIYDQAKAIKDFGDYEVVVFKPKMWYSKERDYVFEGIKVCRFKTYDLPSYMLPGLFDFLSNYSLKRKLKKEKIDFKNIKVVHSHVTRQGSFARFLKKLNPKIKTILQHHGFDVLSVENGRLSKFQWHRKWVEEDGVKICNDIDYNVAVSRKTLNYITNYKSINLKNTYILYNGVDKEKFFPIPQLKDKEAFTVGCVGNFWPLKDQITLLEAAKKLIFEKNMHQLQIKMVGTGETLEVCKKFVIENELESHVHFFDSFEHDKLVYFYNSLDLFVLPSYWEAFGCVYTEAYSCGIPFIGVEGQGIEEIIVDQFKKDHLIAQSDVESLVSLILKYQKREINLNSLTIDLDIKVIMNDFFNVVFNQNN